MVTSKDGESNIANKLAKVQWRCRRGMLELDVMLQSFASEIYPNLPAPKQQLFEDLLEAADQDLQRWLVGSEACSNSKWQDMILVIRHMYARAQKEQQPA